MYNPRARFRHRLVALVLVLSPCSCGALLPEIEAPANVYKLTTKKPWVPDPDRGPEQPWVDVDPNVTLEANQCQLTLSVRGLRDRNPFRDWSVECLS